MGKRPAGVELFEGNMVSMQREIRPSMQRDEPPTMETGLERIADRCCEPTPEERSAGNLHATFCGRRRQATASAHPVCGNGATVEPLRHRQTKGAATDMFGLQPPRHISTLP